MDHATARIPHWATTAARRGATGNRLQPTRLVLICGLPASGKTTLARELTDAYGAVRLNPDELVSRVVARHAAGGIAITEKHMDRYASMFQPPTDDELALYDPPLPGFVPRA